MTKTSLPGLALAVWLLASGGSAPAAVEAPAAAMPDTLTFILADWRALAFGREAAGVAGWVTGPDGSLRVDLMAAEPPGNAGVPASPPESAALLAREGRGWTLVTGRDAAGVYGAWDREWRAPPAGLAALALAVTARAGAGRPAATGPRVLTLAADPGADEGRPDPTAADGFRRGLVTRARGGGGPGERVTIGPGPGGAVRVRSSRRPGCLDVSPRERRTAVGRAAEVFLPWWPLAEVLVFADGAEPGTSAAGRR